MDIILNGKIEPVEVGFDNLEELQEYVDLDTKSVETVIVTPDNLKSCRQMRAYYNGQAKLIHENMRAFQAAYESDFNKKIKNPLQDLEKRYKTAGEEINKRIREVEYQLNPPEPEEVKNFNVYVSVTEKQYKKVLKFLEKEQIKCTIQEVQS